MFDFVHQFTINKRTKCNPTVEHTTTNKMNSNSSNECIYYCDYYSILSLFISKFNIPYGKPKLQIQFPKFVIQHFDADSTTSYELWPQALG